MNYYPYQNQYNPYQQTYPQYPQYQPQRQMVQPQVQQTIGLNGQVVDSIDVVRAKDVDLTGMPTYYPNVNQSEIYVKQLQQDGTSRVMTYRLVNENPVMSMEAPTVSVDILNEVVGQLRQDVLNEIAGIKSLIDPPKTTRGGVKQ